MALGYCRVCDTLRTITPGPQKWGTRERTWTPVAHWVNIHTHCGNIVDEMTNCRACGTVPIDNVQTSRCPGEKKSL